VQPGRATWACNLGVQTGRANWACNLGLQTWACKPGRASLTIDKYVETVPDEGYRFIGVLASNEIPLPQKRQFPKIEATILTATSELPWASSGAVRTLLALVEVMYLSFHFGALGNLQEIHQLFIDANWLSPSILLATLVTTVSLLNPVRLYLLAALGFHFSGLPQKFSKLSPALLPLDLLWALSPFLLIHHISIGLALGMSVAPVYLPFAPRSLVVNQRASGLTLHASNSHRSIIQTV
jgi:hypothetical protein